MMLLARATLLLLAAGAASALTLAPPPMPAPPAPWTPAQARRGAARAPAAPKPKSAQQLSEESMRLFRGHEDGILALAFSPDGAILASGSADQSIILWDVANGTMLKKLDGHAHAVSALAFSADGTKLASGSFDSCIDVWDVTSGQIENRFRDGHPVVHLIFLQENRHLAASWDAKWDANVHVWDIAKEQFQTLTCDGPLSGMVTTPKGELITADDKAGLIVWNPATGRQISHYTRPISNRIRIGGTGPNWTMGISLLADGRVLFDDMTGFWTWDRAADKFDWIGKNLFHLAGPLANDQFYCGGIDGMSFWVRDIHPDGVSMLIGEPFTLHAIAISPKGDFLAFGGGGKWTPESNWRTAGPMDIHVMRVESIVNGMAAEKENRIAFLEKAKITNPAAVLDGSAIYPEDGQPLPWKKLP